MNRTEGLQKIAELAPDLVLLDYRMPGANGLEVLSDIRRTKADLPVIMNHGLWHHRARHRSDKIRR